MNQVLGLLLLISSAAIAVFTGRLLKSLAAAPRLALDLELPVSFPSVSVVIPAYNEEINIADCVAAVLASELPPGAQLEVWVADDQSSDRTLAIAQSISDSRLRVVAVPPRPQTQVWRGKNWACAEVAPLVAGEFLLFIDADVRLDPTAIQTAIAHAVKYETDLLSCAPEIVCGCLAEWLVQPIMMCVLAVGFDFKAVNDPQDPTAFAAGPFMLFQRQVYEQIGGHRAVAAQLVEDVELARLIKAKGLKLNYLLALGIVKVRMYQSFGALWEGWTKNYFLGSQSNIGTTLFSALVMLLVFVIPWLGLAISVVWGWGYDLIWGWAALTLQFRLRLLAANQFGQPLRYGYLSWVGGAVVAAIAVTSIIKTKTGWGWTWRGRPLY
ncbi:MAG: glycosyltransferase family 2 protein [Pseudanabaenaceae cyanobacterium bins.68]|nr:glycosyltransferase family 2 protein [Pseudanabaenaceae cyanobacterium bins.68]